jgi:hypothetical protein
VFFVLCFILFTEATSRALFSIGPLFRGVKGTDDSSNRIAWVQRHSRSQALAFAYDIYDPTRGWAVKRGLRDLVVLSSMIVNSNSRGIRGKSEYNYARQASKHRIVTLGDSFTFGDEVSDDETYSYYLGSLLPDTEVLNLGVHGYGHDQMLLYLKEEGVKYSPDIVILGYVSIDPPRNLLSFRDFAKPKFELAPGGLRLTNVPVPTPESFLAWEPYRPKIFDLVVMAREKARWMLGWNQWRTDAITSAILDELVKTTRENGAVPVFVYLPVLQEIVNSQVGLTPDEQFLDRYCQEKVVACLFLRSAFLEQVKKGASFNTRGHWFAPEHMLAAQATRDFISKKKLLEASGPSVQAVLPSRRNQ